MNLLQCALLEFQKNIIFTDNCWQTWENASQLDVILAGFHHLLIAVNLLIREACWIWHPRFAESELENCWLPLKINYCGCLGGLFKCSETNVLSTNSTPSKNIKRKEWKEQCEGQPALRLHDRWNVQITANLFCKTTLAILKTQLWLLHLLRKQQRDMWVCLHQYIKVRLRFCLLPQCVESLHWSFVKGACQY